MTERFPNVLSAAALLVLASCAAADAWGQESPKSIQEVIARMKPYVGEHRDGVDTSSLKGKVMCGYQGWFAAEGDGTPIGWSHYAKGRGVPEPGNCTFDLWPDVSELNKDERYPTRFKHKDGMAACLFSSCNPRTVLRHFEWMRDYGIDGVFLQRFGSSIKSARGLDHRNIVTANVQAGANRCGRTWAMMYDLSGLRAGDIGKYVMEDWKQLVGRMRITADKAYLHHNGKPVVAVWGIGFRDGRQYSLDECEALVRFLKDDKKYGGNTVMVGVPTGWRTLTRDAVEDKKLHDVIRLADIVSPWTVGRYNSPASAAEHGDTWVKPDIAWTRKNGLDYLPVMFPGFSWQNLKKARGVEAKLDQIPRLKGQFLWSQAVAFKQAGAEMLYVAMFDEIDEGTAIFKCSNDPPVGQSAAGQSAVGQSGFVTYEGLPSDHYLWLAGQAGRLLRNMIPAAERMPLRNAKENTPADAGKPRR